MKLQYFFKIFFTLLFSFSLFANESIDIKVKKLTLELRCMTCQNQSVHDSDSDYSKDIKIFVKKKFEEGLNEKEIKTQQIFSEIESIIKDDPEFLKNLDRPHDLKIL